MAAEMRRIDTSGFQPPSSALDPGAAPMLQWIKIAELVIDPAYQREIRSQGARNVRKIAEDFNWSKFAPVVVAPVAGGFFAIIDGQHRTTAAALRGFESVPAQIITADPGAQAAAFKAINAQTTRIGALEIFQAAVAAGEPQAVALERLATAAGVKILRCPRQVSRQGPNETMSVGTLQRQFASIGPDLLKIALRCATNSANGKRVGVLSSVTIDALCDVVASAPKWRRAPQDLYRAFDGIVLDREADKARLQERAKGEAEWAILARRLRLKLTDVLGQP